MKNLDLKTIPSKIMPLLLTIKRYLGFITVIIILCLYGFMVFYVNNLASSEPTDEQVAEKLKAVQRPRIDEAALKKINELQDQNIQVETLFEQARDNPFNE